MNLIRPVSRLGVAAAALLAMAGCASSSPAPGVAVGQAVTAPLDDLNVVQTEIPPVLQAAKRAPYALPTDPACAALAADVQGLDAVLGPDVDAPPAEGRGVAGQAEDAAVGALRNTAEGVVPFRGWVRKLSGAERRQHEVEAAIHAGQVRRAFLKGVGLERHCPLPAAPRRAQNS
jgi:hypothetical protein